MRDVREEGAKPQQVGVDTGGTFTDVVCVDEQGVLRIHKRLSTPDDPAEAIIEGVGELSDSAAREVVHGTTVATNALLERRGARVALVTTAGFEDLLVLGRQNRPELYDLRVSLPEPLVDSRRCFGVKERISATGAPIEPLTPEAVASLIAWLEGIDAEAVAVCLLHAWVNEEHERRVAEAIEARFGPSLPVSRSSEVMPAFREFERASTTAVNAYVQPLMAAYLRSLADGLETSGLEVMLSSGGRSGARYAADFPVHTVLSGPAGGVVGALACAQEVGISRIITFDMGGTSTDVSLCDAEVSITSEASVSGVPIGVPVIDIHTVGAGGGSLARLDQAGVVRVGPASAGAVPGPACYGLGGVEPTVTDAHLVLGRLRAEDFLGGTKRLDGDAAQEAVGRLAAGARMSTYEMAAGILDIADARMVRALKVISLERGHNPREFTLVAFGGAGGLHACRLAEALEMDRVLIPRNPGVLSAYGMLRSAPQRRYSVSVLAPLEGILTEPGSLARRLRAVEEQARRDMEGVVGLELAVRADLRYAGQSFEITCPVDWPPSAERFEDPTEDFAMRHEALYGYRDEGRPVDLVKVEVIATGVGCSPDVARVGAASESESVDSGRVWFGDGWRRARVVARASLREGAGLSGPCVVTDYSGTCCVPPGWRGVHRRGHLVLERDG